MTRNFNATGTVLLTVLLFPASLSLFAQQSGLQTSFLVPSAIRTVNAGMAASGVTGSIADTEHLPYLKEVAREAAKEAAEASPRPKVFLPTPSDLLIQQAEERFRNGKKAFQDRDFDHARTEFDAAIDVMLTASANPTDRRLFESKLEDMVDVIHRDDLANLGAAAVE